MGFFDSFFKQIVGNKVNQYQQSIGAAVKQKTTGRVNARIINAQQRFDEKVMQNAGKGLSVLDGKNPFKA